MAKKKKQDFEGHTDHEQEPRAIAAIRARANETLVDVVAGPMKLEEVKREIERIVLTKSPEYVLILIEKREDLQKYHTTIYITPGDFKKPTREY